MTTASAVPLWLQQILPRWLTDRPAFTEALWAGLVSIYYASYPIFAALYGVAAADGDTGNLSQFMSWLDAHWFALLMAYVFGGGVAGLRAKQAGDKAAAATPQKGP